MAIDFNQLLDSLVPSVSKYLSQSDIPEEGLLLTIKHFEQENLEGDYGMEAKVVVYFDEVDKGLVLNRTNSQLLSKATFATTVAGSLNKQIILYTDPSIAFGGKIVGGLRIKSAAQKAPKQPVRPQAAVQPARRDPLNRPAVADLENDIPY